MKAVLIKAHGGPENLKYTEDAQMPEIGPGQALVRIKATSVNRADIVVRNGYPGLKIPLPHIPGGDICGIIEEPGDSGFAKGDRVMALPLYTVGRNRDSVSGFDWPEHQHLSLDWKYFGMHVPGSYAEYSAVPGECLVKLPENISFEEASAFGVAGLTAYHGIKSVGKLAEGESFMIWGGSGGLGTIAVQIAKAAGARVIATVGNDSKKEEISSLGADFVYNHNSEDVPAKVKENFPFGVDVALDYVGPATFQKSFDMLKKGGRLLLCGILTGRETNFSIHMAYLRHLSIHGFYLGTKEELKKLLVLAGEGKIKAKIFREFPLSEAPEAHRLLESGNYTGKIILKP